MNKPYVKQYNDKGEVSNPITKENPYKHELLNRSHRRQNSESIEDFLKPSKNFRLVVTRKSKHHPFVQEIQDKETGKYKRVLHYQERNGISVTPRKRVAKSN